MTEMISTVSIAQGFSILPQNLQETAISLISSPQKGHAFSPFSTPSAIEGIAGSSREESFFESQSSEMHTTHAIKMGARKNAVGFISDTSCAKMPIGSAIKSDFSAM